MGIIGWIILVILILGIIGALFEWIFDHLIQIILLAITVVGLIFWTRGTVVIAGIALIGYGLYHLLNTPIKNAFSNHAQKKEFRRAQKQHEAQEKEQALAEKAKLESMPDNAQFIVSEIKDFKNELSKYKQNISDTDMINVVKDFENTVDDLLNKLSDNPDHAKKMQKMVNYYLPTISKLLDKYIGYIKNQDEQSQKMSIEIKESVAALDRALEKLLSELNETEDWDVLADISVMKQMIEMDGLSENGTFSK